MQPTPRFAPQEFVLDDKAKKIEGTERARLMKKYNEAKARLKELIADKEIDFQSFLVDSPKGTEMRDAQNLFKKMVMWGWALDRGVKPGWRSITGIERMKIEAGKVLGHFDLPEAAPEMDAEAMDEQLNNGGQQ